VKPTHVARALSQSKLWSKLYM